MSTETKNIISKSLEKATTYEEYRAMVAQLAIDGKATGPNQSQELSNYTMLNDRRMRRLDKTLKINPEVIERVATLSEKTTFLVLTESWCGDAAQTMPVLNKIVGLNPNFDIKVVLRDQNTDLMNKFLTNGGMSIPKVVMLNENNDVVGDWGPRPGFATKMVADYKKEHGGLTAAFKEELQLWYTKDKGKNTVDDLLELLIPSMD